jgi:HEAT repeat protein
LRAARHPSARVRAHALRLIRRTLERATYLAAARDFLHDDDATVRRSAVRAVGHGRDPEALPALASLLLDPVKWVRDEALSALGLYGEAGLAAIGHRAARARPDEARRLTKAASELRARPDTP